MATQYTFDDGTIFDDGTQWDLAIEPPPVPVGDEMIYAWPIGLRMPAEFDIWPEAPTQVTIGENSELGWTETLTGFSRLRAVITWNVTTISEAMAIEAHLTRLRGRRNGTLVPNYKYTERVGNSSGIWRASGLHRADAERVHITGGSGLFAPGDWIEIDVMLGVPRLYEVLAFSAGIVEIAPALHDNVPDGTAITHLGDGSSTILKDTMELRSTIGPATAFPAAGYALVNQRSAEFVSFRRATIVASETLAVTQSNVAVTQSGVAVTVTV